MDRELMVMIVPDGFRLDWEVGEPEAGARPDRDAAQEALFARLSEDADRGLYDCAFETMAQNDLSTSVTYLLSLAAEYGRILLHLDTLEFLRDRAGFPREEADSAAQGCVLRAPFLVGAEYLDRDWVLRRWEGMHAVFQAEIRGFSGSAAEYFQQKNPALHPVGRVCFHLVENKAEDAPFAFLATYSSRRDEAGRTKHLPLQNALQEFRGDSGRLLQLLTTVHRARTTCPFLAALVDSGEIFQPLGFSADDAYAFLKEVEAYEEAGIVCRIPDWWKVKTRHVGVEIAMGDKPPAMVGEEALLSFRVRLAVGGLEVSEEELQAILAQSEGLAYLKGRWVEVDHAKLREALSVFQKAMTDTKRHGFTLAEAMRFQLLGQAERTVGADTASAAVTVLQGDWLKDLMQRLARPREATAVECGEDFRAELRPYQRQGLGWLLAMQDLGVGACLADDMGLGKTVQVLALINRMRSAGGGKTLLVVPASLISNWESEVARFAPSIRVEVLHPSRKPGSGADADADTDTEADTGSGADVWITTYGMLSRYEWLTKKTWEILVLDEAQAVKNPGTAQAKAVRKISARFRVAMTGTPIENRLGDLWALFDFLDKGLLGSRTEFSTFVKRLKTDASGYARLRQVIAPFLLRRLKTDRAVISDLPEKIEMKTYSSLSKRQAALYAGLIEELRVSLLEVDGIARRGVVLSTLMKCKQICNHPDQYLGQGTYDAADSGKFERLREICATIYEKRERVLVFTQFREITGALQSFLSEVFHHPGLVLHGGTPVPKRRDIVAAFQGDVYVPFLVLSLKAGGVGLNLTAAAHVVHFDRWWNPAVENQATDRAFRIGQKRNVVVHKFVAQGTIEERIDRMIEEKMKLARDVVPEGAEVLLTEMDDRKLMEMFRLVG